MTTSPGTLTRYDDMTVATFLTPAAISCFTYPMRLVVRRTLYPAYLYLSLVSVLRKANHIYPPQGNRMEA